MSSIPPPEITLVNSTDERSSVGSDGAPSAAMVSSAVTAPSAAAGNMSSAPLATTRQKTRHKWKYAIQAQIENASKTELIMTFPFLNDDNDQDFLFSKYLLANGPYKKEYTNKGSAWTGFCKFMTTIPDRNGVFPFLHMAESTAKARFKKYVELSKTWSDKNGDRPSAFLDDKSFPDWVDFENSGYTFGNEDDGLNYAMKIRNHIIEMCEECISMEVENERISKEAQEKEASEVAGVAILKQHAIGRIRNMEEMKVWTSTDDEISDIQTSETGKTGRRGSNKRTSGGFRKNPPDDTGINSYLMNYEAAKKAKDEEKKAYRAAREKRKLEELELKRAQAESEKQRNDAQNDLIAQLMNSQNLMMQHFMSSGKKNDEEV